MKKFKGTQGKWIVENNAYKDDVSGYLGSFDIRSGNEKCAIVQPYEFNNITIRRARANAKLIAAAPLLLEALQSIENDNGSIPAKIWKMRNNAINKALS